ncbi:unnamed protein product [Parnassius apollo]|uniref:(apollo) hypothetical protein n=1 Tax=Parnassius apollo TaxID=110799 RepID=A0A8S3XVN8_PARAO|nr:unnamed protein product [Parnassius apollo]
MLIPFKLVFTIKAAGSAARVLDTGGKMQQQDCKMCKNCKAMSTRLKYYRARLEYLIHLSAELSELAGELDEKIEGVMSAMTAMLKAKAPRNISSGGDGQGPDETDSQSSEQ